MKKPNYPSVVHCLLCDKYLISQDIHDYKLCGCPNQTMVDGGYDYLRYGGVNLDRIEILRMVHIKKGKRK